VTCKVIGGGMTGQAGAMVHGISKAILLYDENLKSTLRINTLEYNLKLNKDLFKFSKKNYTDYYIDSF
jgi:ribosomal protein S9